MEDVSMLCQCFLSFFLLFTLGNISLPGTSSFIGEFLILAGIFQTNTFIACLACSVMVLGAAYSLWLYNRVVFGNFKTQYIHHFADLNRREFWILFPFAIAVLWMGIYPEIFLDAMHTSVAQNITEFKSF